MFSLFHLFGLFYLLDARLNYIWGISKQCNVYLSAIKIKEKKKNILKMGKLEKVSETDERMIWKIAIFLLFCFTLCSFFLKKKKKNEENQKNLLHVIGYKFHILFNIFIRVWFKQERYFYWVYWWCCLWCCIALPSLRFKLLLFVWINIVQNCVSIALCLCCGSVAKCKLENKYLTFWQFFYSFPFFSTFDLALCFLFFLVNFL